MFAYILAGPSGVSNSMFHVLSMVEALRLGVQKEALVGGGGIDGVVGLGVGEEPRRWRRANVRPSAKETPRMKRKMKRRTMLHFLVKILCGFSGFCFLGVMAGAMMGVSLVRGVLNIPPEDMFLMAAIRFDEGRHFIPLK